MNAALKESIELYAELSDQNHVWAKICADQAKFPDVQILWFRFGDVTFARYVQGQKL